MEEPVCSGVHEVCENTDGAYRCVCAEGHMRRDGECIEDKPPGTASLGGWGCCRGQSKALSGWDVAQG